MLHRRRASSRTRRSAPAMRCARVWRPLAGRLAPQGEIDDCIDIVRRHAAADDRDVVAASRRARKAPMQRSSSAAMRPDDPGAYGRLVLGRRRRARAHCRGRPTPSREELAIELVNGGIMALAARHAADLVGALDRNNAKSEFYLTDIVPIARAPRSRLPRCRIAGRRARRHQHPRRSRRRRGADAAAAARSCDGRPGRL